MCIHLAYSHANSDFVTLASSPWPFQLLLRNKSENKKSDCVSLFSSFFLTFQIQIRKNAKSNTFEFKNRFPSHSAKSCDKWRLWVPEFWIECHSTLGRKHYINTLEHTQLLNFSSNKHWLHWLHCHEAKLWSASSAFLCFIFLFFLRFSFSSFSWIWRNFCRVPGPAVVLKAFESKTTSSGQHRSTHSKP